MNTKQIQTEVFKRLLSRDRVSYEEIDERNIVITFDGYRGYFLEKKDLCFDLSLCHKLEGLCNYFNISNDSKKLEKQNEIIIARDGRFIQKLKSETFDIHVRLDYIKPFLDCDLYAESPNSHIIAVNRLTGKPVAIVLPIRGGKTFV